MILPVILLIAGIFGLWLGSSIVVEAAIKIALRLKVSLTLIGLTVISIGASIPEIFTNIASGVKVSKGIEASSIAIGTNIGSDVTQITFILGFTALLGTMYATKKLLKRDGLMVLFSIAAVFIVGITGYKVSFFEGMILLLIYIFYLCMISKDEHVVGKAIKNIIKEKTKKEHPLAHLRDFILIIIGIAILIYASNLVVNNALKLAEMRNVAQSFISVMIIGVGTGLPELSIAIRAITKKVGDISLGALIGSNITDPMFSLPLGAIFSGTVGLTFEKNLLFFDIPFWFIVSIIALFLFKKRMKIGKEDRKEGLILIALYLIFVFIKIKFFMQ